MKFVQDKKCNSNSVVNKMDTVLLTETLNSYFIKTLI